MTLDEAISALLDEFFLEDYIYHVREQARGLEDGYEGNSWHHPLVKRFSEVCETLKKHRA